MKNGISYKAAKMSSKLDAFMGEEETEESLKKDD